MATSALIERQRQRAEIDLPGPRGAPIGPLGLGPVEMGCGALGGGHPVEPGEVSEHRVAQHRVELRLRQETVIRHDQHLLDERVQNRAQAAGVGRIPCT